MERVYVIIKAIIIKLIAYLALKLPMLKQCNEGDTDGLSTSNTSRY